LGSLSFAIPISHWKKIPLAIGFGLVVVQAAPGVGILGGVA